MKDGMTQHGQLAFEWNTEDIEKYAWESQPEREQSIKGNKGTSLKVVPPILEQIEKEAGEEVATVMPKPASEMEGTYQESINLKYIIAHEINLENGSPYLSSSLMNIGSMEKKYMEFFREHISSQNKNSHNRMHKFRAVDSDICKGLEKLSENWDNEHFFIQKTRELTNNLYRVIDKSNSTSGGIVFFLTYTIADEYRYFSILKMKKDSKMWFNQKENTLGSMDNILPDPTEALHKCAFIRLDRTDDESSFDLHIIDIQTKGGTKFFLKNFLDAEEISNDEVMTKRVRDLLHKYRKKLHLGEADQLQLRFDIDRTLGVEREIEVEDLLEKLWTPYVKCDFEREILIKTFMNELQKKYTDVQFRFIAKSSNKYVTLSTPNKDVQIRYRKSLEENNLIIIEHKDNEIIIRLRELTLPKPE